MEYRAVCGLRQHCVTMLNYDFLIFEALALIPYSFPLLCRALSQFPQDVVRSLQVPAYPERKCLRS